jgi:hypothetical protein
MDCRKSELTNHSPWLSRQWLFLLHDWWRVHRLHHHECAVTKRRIKIGIRIFLLSSKS